MPMFKRPPSAWFLWLKIILAFIAIVGFNFLGYLFLAYGALGFYFISGFLSVVLWPDYQSKFWRLAFFIISFIATSLVYYLSIALIFKFGISPNQISIDMLSLWFLGFAGMIAGLTLIKIKPEYKGNNKSA